MADETASTKATVNKDAKHAGEENAGGAKNAKAGNWIEKHKAIAYGGMALILVVLFIFLRKNASASSSNTASTADDTQGSIDPATGYLYGSPADTAALGGSGSSTSVPGSTSTTTTNNYGSPGSTSTTTAPKSPVSVNAWDESITTKNQSLSSLAKSIGIPVSSFGATNAAGKTAIANPGKATTGAKFDYTVAPGSTHAKG